ncbi:MAG: hypothetical protein ACTTKY_00600 [Catonella sp.]
MTKKYILEENILDKNSRLIEYGHDHVIESWDTLPDEEELFSVINGSICRYKKDKKAYTCCYTLQVVNVDEGGYVIGEWEGLRYFRYEIDKARKNKSEYEYQTEFISYVESCESWDDIEPEEYASHLEDVGLNYYSYDDPDMMFQDYKKAVEGLTVKIEEY